MICLVYYKLISLIYNFIGASGEVPPEEDLAARLAKLKGTWC